MNNKRMVLGSFDAERFWKDKQYSELPNINDSSAKNIIKSMDELLFPFCDRGDVLLTRFSMNNCLLEYYEQIGLNFINNNEDIEDCDFKETNRDKSIFELLYFNKKSSIHKLLECIHSIRTYATIPYTKKTCEKYSIYYSAPDISIIKKVNSKIYSFELNEKFGTNDSCRIINSSEELETIPYNKFLIKDVYGVSGKGNMLISSPRILKRVIKHVESQEKKGLKTCFIVEQYLEKDIDFSCQLTISENATYNIVSIQKIINSGFSYLGSMSADEDFINALYKKGYFNIIDKVAKELINEGYFGDVCIDSMILKNKDIVPIVEINARKSMGLINYYMDKWLESFSVKGYFVFFSLGFKGLIQMQNILNAFEDERLLFNAKSKYGIIPMSSNTLFSNRDRDKSYNEEKVYKGRFYFCVASKTAQEKLEIIEKAKQILKSLGFKVYN